MTSIKKCLIINLFLTISFILTASSHAGDVSAPHKLKSGEVISAEVLNELFEYYQTISKDTASSDIIGSWSCSRRQFYGGSAYYFEGYSSESYTATIIWNLNVDFADNGDGTFSWTSSPGTTGSIFEVNSASYENLGGEYTLLGNTFYVKYTGDTYIRDYLFSKVSDTRIRLNAMTSFPYETITCDKESTPPIGPISLTAASADLTTTLNWIDNSIDETAFKVLRKDSLIGNYSEIATTSADATNYVDSNLPAGTYWYRIKATNANGDSLGSNVAKVVIGE